MPRTIRLTLQYVGTRYAGWQWQPGPDTIQGRVQDALGRILDEPVRLDGAGRTDAGVHARGQVASFVTRSDRDEDAILRGVNGLLPWDIRIVAAESVPAGFHARKSAIGKEYRYQICTAAVLPPFLQPFAAHVTAPLDAGRFTEAARELLGEHDFTGFASAGGSEADPVRTLTASDLVIDGSLWVYRVECRGFLRKMVRNITGTLIEVARGRWDPSRIRLVLEARDRRLAGPAAPPQGLFLERVKY